MRIVVNGQEYSSWDEVPEAVRAGLGGVLPDRDDDGVPDAFQTPQGIAELLAAAAGSDAPRVVSSTSISVNGQQYGSVDELPPEIRERLAQAGLLGGGSLASAPPGGTGRGSDGSAPGGTQSWPTMAPESSRPPTPGAPPRGQLLLDGVPIDPSQGPPGVAPTKKRRWWSRG